MGLEIAHYETTSSPLVLSALLAAAAGPALRTNCRPNAKVVKLEVIARGHRAQDAATTIGNCSSPASSTTAIASMSRAWRNSECRGVWSRSPSTARCGPSRTATARCKVTFDGQGRRHSRQGQRTGRALRRQLRPRRDAGHLTHRLQRRHLPRLAKARTASSFRCAATIRSSIIARWSTTSAAGASTAPRPTQPDAAEAVRRRAARRRRADPAGRAVLRDCFAPGSRRRQARSERTAGRQDRSDAGESTSFRCRA